MSKHSLSILSVVIEGVQVSCVFFACCQFSHRGFSFFAIGFHTIAVCLCSGLCEHVCVNDTAAANSKLNYNASGDVTTLTGLKKQINKGFPTGAPECVHLNCV